IKKKKNYLNVEHTISKDNKKRKIDTYVVRKIDELSKKNEMSRNEYLKTHLHAYFINNMESKILQRYEKQIDANMILLEKTNEKLEKVTTAFNELIEIE